MRLFVLIVFIHKMNYVGQIIIRLILNGFTISHWVLFSFGHLESWFERPLVLTHLADSAAVVASSGIGQAQCRGHMGASTFVYKTVSALKSDSYCRT